MKKIILFITISISLIACSRTHPIYVPKPNTYSFTQSLNNNGQLISESLIYTFSTETLNTIYTKSFCGGLKDCRATINNVQSNPAFGGFNLDNNPIIKNPTNTSLVKLYRLLYTTTGQNGEPLTVSGAVFMPNIKPQIVKGVVLFFHQTYFAKGSAPSYSYIYPTHNAEIASILATQGYIIVAPDYIGLGYDKKTVHPYITYPQVNAVDGLSMLIATREFLNKKDLFINETLPLFVSGYSEGGSYALWFSRLYQEQSYFKRLVDKVKFKLMQVSPMSGTYNLSGVIVNYIFSNINFLNEDAFMAENSTIAGILKPGLLAMAMVSYTHYSHNAEYKKIFNPDFFNMKCNWQSEANCSFNGKQVNLLEAFSQSDDKSITLKIYNAASFKIGHGSVYTNQTNNVGPLINPEIFTSTPFINLLQNADIYYWKSTIPTTLIHLQRDSVVSPYNSIYANLGMLASNSINLKRVEINNDLIKVNFSNYLPSQVVNHVVALPHLLLVAVNQFNQALKSNNR